MVWTWIVINLHSMLKFSCAGCFSLSPAILVQFTLEMRVAAQNRKKFTKTPYFGSSRSLMLTFLRSLLPVLVMISRTSVPICNHFHVRWANNGRITLFRGILLFVGTFFTKWHEILSQNTRDPKLSNGENPKPLSHLVLEWYRDVTDATTPKQNYYS